MPIDASHPNGTGSSAVAIDTPNGAGAASGSANGVTNGTHGSGALGLRVVVIGAGIGGLTAALYLRKQGHKVTLLEQSRFANELGAAMHLAPNSNGLLRRIGLNVEDIGANLMERVSSPAQLVAVQSELTVMADHRV
jgi:NADPH-dependent 2,4-dienoyl-CoA reductase/sulfur reductase-like enzyme